MDTTTAVVVFLFVMTILSSLGGKGYSPPVPTEVVYTEVSIVEFPDPTYFEVVGEPARVQIGQYVSKHRGPEEAEIITDSIMRYSQQYDLNPKLVAALIARESRFNPSAVSKSGAIGLGQLLPSTVEHLKIENPYDIDQNVKGTARYLKRLLDKFSGYSQQVSYALASYLEGPNAVSRQGGFTSHTKAYVEDILKIYQRI